MQDNLFYVDLGQGDGIGVKTEKEYTIEDFVQDLQNSKEWVILNECAVRKDCIKKIVKKN